MFSISDETRELAGFVFQHAGGIVIIALFAMAMWFSKSPKRYVPLIAADIVILTLILYDVGVLPL